MPFSFASSALSESLEQATPRSNRLLLPLSQPLNNPQWIWHSSPDSRLDSCFESRGYPAKTAISPRFCETSLVARSRKSWLFSQARIIVFWRHPVGGDNGTRTREEARWGSPNYLQAAVCKISFCFLTHLTHALTAATEWLGCTKEMVSKHYSSFLHWIRNWGRTVQKYDYVFYEAVLSITRVNPRAAYSDSVGLYLNSRNYFEVNGPNRIHFLFAIRLSSKLAAKEGKRGYE